MIGKIACGIMVCGMLAFGGLMWVALWKSDPRPSEWHDILYSDEYRTTRAIILVGGFLSLYGMRKGE